MRTQQSTPAPYYDPSCQHGDGNNWSIMSIHHITATVLRVTWGDCDGVTEFVDVVVARPMREPGKPASQQIDELASDIHSLVRDVDGAEAYLRIMFGKAVAIEHYPREFKTRDPYHYEGDVLILDDPCPSRGKGLSPWQPGEDRYDDDVKLLRMPIEIKAAWLAVIHDVQLPREEPVLLDHETAYYSYVEFFFAGLTWQMDIIQLMRSYLVAVTADIERIKASA